VAARRPKRRRRPQLPVIVVATAIALAAGAVISHRALPSVNHPLGKLGPTPGPSSEGHVAAKRAYLSGLERRSPDASAAGLVSFTRLLSASDVGRTLGGLRVSAVFVSFPSGRPEALAVRRTTTAAMSLRASQLVDATKADIAALAARRDPSSRQLLDERRRELAQTSAQCACIYGAVVQHTTVRRLGDLARSGDVRLVDAPDPLTDDLSGWQLTPIFPQNTP